MCHACIHRCAACLLPTPCFHAQVCTIPAPHCVHACTGVHHPTVACVCSTPSYLPTSSMHPCLCSILAAYAQHACSPETQVRFATIATRSFVWHSKRFLCGACDGRCVVRCAVCVVRVVRVACGAGVCGACVARAVCGACGPHVVRVMRGT